MIIRQQSKRKVYGCQGSSPVLELFPDPITTIQAGWAPSTTDNSYTGQVAINETDNTIYMLTNARTGNWQLLGSTSATSISAQTLTATVLTTLTGEVNINTSGAGVTTINTGGTGATNIGNATGGIAVTGATTITGALGVTGDVTVTSGNLITATAGKGLKVKTGSNAKAGTATLVAGTVSVSNTSVLATSCVVVCPGVAGGTPGQVYVTSITAATGFVITSTSATDTSTVNWVIIDQN
jgi:hypothetical protein